MKRTHDCQGVARPSSPEQSIYRVPQVGHARFTWLTRADEKADFVPLFPGTVSGYRSSKKNEDDSHPHRYRSEYAMRTRLKLLTVGVVLVTAAVAGCTSSTPEPAAPAGATQDAVDADSDSLN